MNKLIQRQTERLNTINKSYNNFKKDAEDKKTRSYLTTRVKTLEDNWNKFNENHEKIYEKCESFDIEYFKDDMYSKAEEAYVEYLSLLNDKLETYDSTKRPPLGESTIVVQHNESDLPKIQIPIFDGSYQSWTSFKDLFVSIIHENNSISMVQKLHHLKTHVRGEAESLLRHISITADNYQVAWDCLVQRYENKRVLVNTYLNSLFSLSTLTSETAQGLRKIIDVTNQSLKGLENLGINIRGWDVLIIFMLIQRLPTETHKSWEQKLGTKTDIPSLQELLDFLGTRFRALEAIHSNDSRRSLQVNQSTTNKVQGSKVRVYHNTNHLVCILCEGAHSIRQCTKFIQMNKDERNSIVRKKGLCINCLGQGHLMSRCTSTRSCFKCGKKHHSMLHLGGLDSSTGTKENRQETQVKERETGNTSKANQEETIQTYFTEETLETSTLLATALIIARSTSGKEVVLRALLDQGSQASFVTEEVAQLLNLKRIPVSTLIAGLGANTETSRGRVKLTIHSRLSDYHFEIEAYVLRKITSLLPTNRINKDNTIHWDHLNQLSLADPSFHKPGRIDVLLGVDVLADILLEGIKRGPKNAPVAQNTVLGWVLFGQTKATECKQPQITNLHTHLDLSEQIKRFWEIEETNFYKNLNFEEEQCELVFKENFKRTASGRYIVKLPFKNTEKERLGRSRDIAINRLLQIERKFKMDPILRQQYTDCLNEYLALGHMVPAKTTEGDYERHENGKTWYECSYLPHHSVIKESSSTTRLRVVFDASQKTHDGPSLNDILMTGPTIQDDIMAILMRWRTWKFSLTADITKMYRQVRVWESDTNFQRIVWRTSEHEPIRDYCLQTVTFGTTCAPFLAIRALQQLAYDEKETYPLGAQMLLNDFYVDDLISGADNISEAMEKQKQITQILQRGGFQIRKWQSNEKIILQKLANNEKDETQPFNIDSNAYTKALGIYWFPKEDSFLFKTNFGTISDTYTKRQVLSDISKLFDPLGWLAPVIVQAKIIMQKIWLAGVKWDDKIEGDILNNWLSFKYNLKDIEDIKIPRWISMSQGDLIQLHGFSDASQVAYGAAVYIHVTKPSSIKTHLVIAKTRVAPLKSISLPRLELCAAALLAKLLVKVKTTLKLKDDVQVHAWTDSTIVLAWIKGQPHRWKSFVANKVSEIHSAIDAHSWRHVSSADNPADAASRGISPKILRNSTLWWHGPSWLQGDELLWPKSKTCITTDLEAKRIKTFMLTSDNFNEDILNKYSSLSKLLRVTAYIFRFVYLKKEYQRYSWLTAKEIERASKYWIRYTQKKYYSEELRKWEKDQRVSKSSPILNLNPFVDDEKILRVRGRLEHAKISENQKNPIILPEKAYLTKLIIDDAHKTTLHGGSQLMLNILRKRFWIVNVRNNLRSHLYKCVKCHRQKTQTLQQLMGNLPSARVCPSRPFTHTGIDYCGPFNIKTSSLRSIKIQKSYVAIFVCMSVKAVHIELVSNLSSEAFLAALRRFVSRRGLCTDLYSDCGTNFIGAQTLLKNDFEKCMSEINKELANECSKRGINWHFNPPSAPHFGGLWEAGVKSLKYHLRRVVGTHTLTYEELNTVLTQVEACLNSRPLCPLTSDPQDEQVLTPGHFLIGEALLAPPEPNLIDVKETLLNRWKFTQRIYHQFWKRWSIEYLNRLQQRPKWLVPGINLKAGNIVVIKEDNLPPMKWRIGRIVEVHPGKDGLTRVVTVRTQGTEKKRPITKISLLPIQDNVE